MVKFLASIFLLLATLSSLAFASPLQPDGINKFIGDLHQLSTSISHLVSAVNSIGTKLTAAEALAIHTSSVQVQSDLNQANSEVKGVHHVSYKDAKTVLGITAGFAPVLVEGLGRFGEKKPVIEKFPGVSIHAIEAALKGLHNSVTELTSAIVDLEPSSLKKEAKDIKSKINTAFEKTIKIYS